MTDAHLIATAEQAGLLLDVRLRPLLGLLMSGDRSATEVAAQLDTSVQRACYLLGKLTRAGVARQVGLRPRAGRAVRYYSVPPRWFIPFQVTGAETLEQFVEAQILPRMERFVGLSVRQIGLASRDWGYWLDGGNLQMGDPEGEANDLFQSDEALLLNIGTVRLNREDALALQRGLLTMLQEFVSQADPHDPAYTVGLLMARGEVD